MRKINWEFTGYWAWIPLTLMGLGVWKIVEIVRHLL